MAPKRSKKSDHKQEDDSRNRLALAKLENSLEKINNVITSCSDAAAQLSKEGKFDQMLAVINAPGYLSSVEAIKECFRAVSNESNIQDSSNDTINRTTVSNSRYDVLITTKANSTMSPMQAYQHAIKIANIQASDWHDTDAKSTRFEMMCIEHANQFEHILRTGIKEDGTKLADLVEVSILIASAYSIKTVAITTADHAKITWVQGTEVELNNAMDILRENNHFWFHSNSDIENVSVHSNNKGKYWVTVFISKNAFHRFLSYPGNIRKLALDGNLRPVMVYEQVKHDVCYNCLEVCPGSSQCKKPTICRFCGGQRHKSNECRNKKQPTCFRCRVAPTEKEIQDIHDELTKNEDIADDSTQKTPHRIHAEQLGYDHDALSNKCNFIRGRINTVLAQKRATAKNGTVH